MSRKCPATIFQPMTLRTELLELPQTAGCLVCGRDNPIGLHLRLAVDPATGHVTTNLTPGPHHIGFAGLIHGGLLATALDEAMVWAAIWSSRRACVAAEMTVRYKQKVAVGQALKIDAWITRARPRLIETEAIVSDGTVVHCTATAKYAPLDTTATVEFFRTFVARPETEAAAELLRA
jgi:acyl-coenzyme A thioesterase PaaI-like protein